MLSSSPSFARLTSTSYTTWSGDMEAWLKSQGLWRIVSGSQKRPELKSPSPSKDNTAVESATATAAADAQAELLYAKTTELQDAWDAKSDKAAGWIWLMLDQDQKTLVDGCKDDPQIHPPTFPAPNPGAVQAAVCRLRYASILPTADRNDPASSEDQLSQPVFSPEPIPLHPQYSLGGAASSISAPAAQWSHAAAPEWTESAHESGAPQAKGPVSFSPADIAEALDVAAQWFNACVPPREDDTSTWESVRSMQTSINRMVSNIRRTDWSHAISMANDEDADLTVRHHARPPHSSRKGKERAAPPPQLPPSSPYEG
ncbi:hypothetical protein H1R20_g14104, partial [Candolleomyces eurysporus]